jgi:hypothetical protein
MVETSTREFPLSAFAVIDTLNDRMPSLVHETVTMLLVPVAGTIASVVATGPACDSSLGSMATFSRIGRSPVAVTLSLNLYVPAGIASSTILRQVPADPAGKSTAKPEPT